ncbi:protein of unknown function (DUF4219) [Popillia japonica]|uniref:DUF4219 domain-containing protein n=1 Tax=Popillia japonica TaxID=7064 RepID=A0AAW1IFE7_POPJA
MAQTNSPTIERLVGRENYNTWKFAMQALLEHEDLWGCVTGDAMYTEDTAEKYISEPQTVQEALESPDKEKWISAIKAEHDSILENNTWELVDL